MLSLKKSAPLFPSEDLQSQILVLSLEEMEGLLGWLKAILKERKQSNPKKANSKKASSKKASSNKANSNKANPADPIPLKKGRELVEIVSDGKVTYQLERVKCGKKKCKCNQGELHGPYWYAYHWDGKKLASTYIGKTLNEFPVAEEVPVSNGVVPPLPEDLPSEG